MLRLGIEDGVPDCMTLWLFRETLAKASLLEKLFERLGQHLEAKGYKPGANFCGSVPSLGYEFEPHSAGGGRSERAQAALTVLASRQAMVIGPTPPGTGVIAPAT